MNWISSFFQEYPQGKNLQRSGIVPKEKVVEFFKKGLVVFDSSDFNQHLKACFTQGQNCQDVVNQMQMGIFESIGVQGDYGIGFLGQVRTTFADDADIMQVGWVGGGWLSCHLLVTLGCPSCVPQ